MGKHAPDSGVLAHFLSTTSHASAYLCCLNRTSTSARTQGLQGFGTLIYPETLTLNEVLNYPCSKFIAQNSQRSEVNPVPSSPSPLECVRINSFIVYRGLICSAKSFLQGVKFEG